VTYTLHPRAEQDVAEALDFYTEKAGAVVASRFLAEFERVAELLVEHPDSGALAARGRRVFPLQVFPYSIVIGESRAAFESWWSGITIGILAMVEAVSRAGLWTGACRAGRLDQDPHSVSVDSGSIGTKKPFSGQARSHSSNP
jgi:toxin ParE1/3/4